MSTYIERLREMQAIEQRRRDAAEAIERAKRILDNETCTCGFCVSRRDGVTR